MDIPFRLQISSSLVNHKLDSFVGILIKQPNWETCKKTREHNKTLYDIMIEVWISLLEKWEKAIEWIWKTPKWCQGRPELGVELICDLHLYQE